MSKPQESDTLRQLLISITAVLNDTNQHCWANVTRELASSLTCAHGEIERRQVVRRITTLFNGGMGSFNDLILQDAHGVLPSQSIFSNLRNQLFQEVRNEL
jgi:hypothetical protein